jgi:hypothetical protein
MMFERVQCSACGGVYVPQQPGGTYYHACPPVRNPAYQPDMAAAGYDPRETIPRPGGRDENLRPAAPRRDGEPGPARPPAMVAEGAGVRALADDELPAPVRPLEGRRSRRASPRGLAAIEKRKAARR